MKKTIPIETPWENLKNNYTTTDKIIASIMIILFTGIILAIIITSEKQKDCGQDIQNFCNTNHMTYTDMIQNKYTCTQTLIGNYTQKFYFTCEYETNLTKIILQKTEMIK